MKFLYCSLFIFILILSCDENNAKDTTTSSLEVIVYTANETGSVVNSIIILGKKEAILIDAQLLKQGAQDVVQMIQNSGRELTHIFITHSHPDHYMGLAIFQDAFPDARIVATEEVEIQINKNAKATFDSLKAIFGDLMADRYVIPKILNSYDLFIEGNSLPVFEYKNIESKELAAVYIPSMKAFLSSDLIYNNVFLWLAEKQPDRWIEVLNDIAKMDINIIYPGHGASAQGTFLIEENKKYITDFIAATQAPGATAQTVIDTMKAQYPLYEGNYLLQASAEAYFPPKQTK